jgi:hypothetical protein
VIQQEPTMTVNYNPDIEIPRPPLHARPISYPISYVGKSATEARQGVISGRVLLVLVASMSLAIVGLTVAYLVA